MLKNNSAQDADLMFVSGSTYLLNREQNDGAYDALFGTGYSRQMIMLNKSFRYWKRRVLLTMSRATGMLLASSLAERVAKFMFSTCDSFDDMKEELDPREHQAVNSWFPFAGFLRAAGWLPLRGKENQAKTPSLCLVHEKWRGREAMELFRSAFLREALCLGNGHLDTSVGLLRAARDYIPTYELSKVDPTTWSCWGTVRC